MSDRSSFHLQDQNQGAQGGVPADIVIDPPAFILRRNQAPRGDDSVGGVSVASQGSAAIFQQRARRTLLEIEQDEIIVRKADRGAPGSKVYVTNRIGATQSLSSKFLGSFHLQSKNADGENVQKSKHIQDEFVSNLEVIKKFKERVHQYDMRTPLQVPAVYRDVIAEDAWEARWDAANPNRSIVDLTVHWGKLPLDHILKWQRDFNGYSDDDDHVSNIWIKDLLSSSMDPELKKQVDEQYSELDLYQQGGISYFKITVDTVFKMSIMAEESLKSFIKDFGKNGLAEIPGENVWHITFQVDGVAERLADSGLLRSESLTQYVEGFTYCSVAKFKMVFVNKSVELTYLDAIGGSSLASMSSSDVLLKIKEVSLAAVTIYDHLQLGKKWNIPGKHVNAALVPKCDNCGDHNHLSNKCPKPRDEEKCKKAREARAKSRDSEGGRGGRGRGDGGAGRGSSSDGQRAPWDSTAKGTNGVMMIDGVWKMLCNKGCGWNETHTTKYHDEYQRSAATFKIPAHHPYWLLSGKAYTAAAVVAGALSPSVAGATQIPTDSASLLAGLTGVVDRHLTNVESSEMSSFLGDLRDVLGN